MTKIKLFIYTDIVDGILAKVHAEEVVITDNGELAFYTDGVLVHASSRGTWAKFYIAKEHDDKSIHSS